MKSLFRPGTTLRWDLLVQFRKNRVFVETGTYTGIGIQVALDCGFEEMHSIEIDPGLYEKAKELYRDVPIVHLYLGDSASTLWPVIEKIDARIVFWLDGHTEPGYKVGIKDVPIFEELEAIKRHHIKDHVILIDDINMIGTNTIPPVSDKMIIDTLRDINPEYEIDYGHHPSPMGGKYTVLMAYTDRLTLIPTFNFTAWKKV